MALYEKKFHLNDFAAALSTCERTAELLYSQCEETDDYFANAAGQYYKLRRYNPPISVPIHAQTGEMWHGNTLDIIQNDSAADWIISHRFIFSDKEHKSEIVHNDVAVLSAQTPEQGNEIARLMRLGTPLDTQIVKQRSAYGTLIDGQFVLIHLDQSVTNQDGHDLGPFIEFQIKTPPATTIPKNKQDSIFDTVCALFGSCLGKQQPLSYRDLMHQTYGDFGPWVKTLPEAELKKLRDIPEMTIQKGEMVIKDNDTTHQNGFFILEGKVKVFYENGLEIRTIQKHDFFGEMACKSPEKRRNAHVQALTDMKVKCVPEGLLKQFYQDITISNHFLNRYLEDEALRTKNRHTNNLSRHL